MLPKLDTPIYNIELPLTKKKLRYRSFLVKEEKILLMAMESQEDDHIMSAVKQVVNNCCLDELDVDDLPLIDLEYFFLKLRARSISEVSDLQYKCNNRVTDNEGNEKVCGNMVEIKVNLLEIEPEQDPKHSNKIEFSDKMGMVMRYPNVKMMTEIKGDSELEKIMSIILNCVDYIYDQDNIYYKKDIKEEELVDFVESMNKVQFEKVQQFFSTIPKMQKNLHFHCGKCGYEEDILVEGMQNFFV